MDVDLIPINGIGIEIKQSLSHSSYIEFSNDEQYREFIKQDLATRIAKMMIERKMIEYTSEERPETDGCLIRARIYLLRDDQVRYLRRSTDVFEKLAIKM